LSIYCTQFVPLTRSNTYRNVTSRLLASLFTVKQAETRCAVTRCVEMRRAEMRHAWSRPNLIGIMAEADIAFFTGVVKITLPLVKAPLWMVFFRLLTWVKMDSLCSFIVMYALLLTHAAVFFFSAD